MVWKFYFLSLMTFVANETDDAHLYTLTDSLQALFQLMSMTEQACGGIDWCTVRNGSITDTLHGGTRTGCCAVCSCNQTCMSLRTCCPDYKLSKALENRVYSNMSQLISELTKINGTNDTDINNVYDEGRKQENMDCLKSWMFDISPKRPIGPMYLMVSKCSNSTYFTADVKSKCETDPLFWSDVHIENFLPVQSMKTGHVYRNKFCAKCSFEENATFTEWNVYMASFWIPTGILNGISFTLDEVLHTRVFGKSSVLFKPSDALKKFSAPNVCHTFDIDSCPIGNNTRETVRRACEEIVQPIVYQQDRVFITKNLACSRCNDVSMDGCTMFYRFDSYEPFLGRILFNHINDEGDSGLIGTRFSEQCSIDYWYDEYWGKCRRINCPCGMVAHSARCVPIVHDVYIDLYRVHVEMCIQNKAINDKVTDEHGFVLYQYVRNAFKHNIMFSYHHISLWRSKRRVVNYCSHFAAITFRGLDRTSVFIEAMRMVKKYFSGVKTITLQTDELSIHMDISDSKQMAKHVVQDVATNIKYDKVISTKELYESTEPELVLPIYKCNFCHMVEILPDEYIQRGRFLYIKRTRKITVMPAKLGRRLFVCTADAFETKAHNHKTREMTVDKTYSSVNNHGSESEIKELVFLGTLLMVVAVVIVTLKCKTYTRRNAEHTNQNGEQRNQNGEQGNQNGEQNVETQL